MGRPRRDIDAERGKRLKTIIEEQKITQKRLAELIHISPETLSNIINGKANLTEDNARRIVDLYPEYSLFWLLGLDRPKTAIENAQHVIDKANTMYRDQKYSAYLRILNDLGYDTNLSDTISVHKTESNETVVLSKEEAVLYYEEIQHMIKSYVHFHFAHRKERS